MERRKIYKVNAVINDGVEINQNFDFLKFSKSKIIFKDIEIKAKDIKNIDISMCSSQAGIGITYNLYRLNYYVDVNISINDDRTFFFQIMNSEAISEIIKWLKENNILYIDKLNVEEIFSKYTDSLDRWNYINRRFGKWSKEYDLDNPRENYLDSISDSFEETINEDIDSFTNHDTLKKANLKKLKNLMRKSNK